MWKAMLAAVLCTISVGPVLAADAPVGGANAPGKTSVQVKESKQEKGSWDWGNRKRASGDPHVQETKARAKNDPAKDAKVPAAK